MTSELSKEPEMTVNGNNGKSRIAAWVGIAVLVTSGFWNVLHNYVVSDKPSRTEVKEIVRETSPYMAERSMILQRLDDLKMGQKETQVKIDILTEKVLAERRRRE